MRTAEIDIDGKSYLLCFSGRVIRNVSERFGGVQEMYTALGDYDQVKSLDAAVWVLSQMIQAGDRYAGLNGLDNPGSLTFDQLYDLFDIQDFVGLYGKIKETITSGGARTVAAKPDEESKGKKKTTPLMGQADLGVAYLVRA